MKLKKASCFSGSHLSDIVSETIRKMQLQKTGVFSDGSNQGDEDVLNARGLHRISGAAPMKRIPRMPALSKSKRPKAERTRGWACRTLELPRLPCYIQGDTRHNISRHENTAPKVVSRYRSHGKRKEKFVLLSTGTRFRDETESCLVSNDGYTHRDGKG